jgi:hypothetical protein
VTRPVALRLGEAGLLLIGVLAGYWLGARDARPAEARACALGLALANDTGARFDEKQAVEDADALAELSIDDPGVRRASDALVKRLPLVLAADDVDDQLAAMLAGLEKACASWLAR